MPRDTGFPLTDAQFDFARARRRRALARLANRLRGQPGAKVAILPFEEVVEALGRRGERRLGLQSIQLDSIVGTVDRGREFDRGFRPTSPRPRGRFERIATAKRRGESMPPIRVYRVANAHFRVTSDQRIESDELRELAEDSGVGEVPGGGEEGEIIARLSAESQVKKGEEAELFIDGSHIQLFDPQSGASLTAG